MPQIGYKRIQPVVEGSLPGTPDRGGRRQAEKRIVLHDRAPPRMRASAAVDLRHRGGPGPRGRVLGVFDMIALGGILLASLSAGILLARSGLDVVLIVIGAGIPALGLPGLPTLLRPTGLRRRWPNGCARVELLSALDLLTDADRNTLEWLAAAEGAASHPVSHPRHVRSASSGSSAGQTVTASTNARS